ncbi:hypothetical protein A9Q96_09850 [Rhodobacterales bacterium 52_120_T64]|nr:hypothetical protein A9Q96_09850 [Rhodobacterales bacterium 52_120_T64]
MTHTKREKGSTTKSKKWILRHVIVLIIATIIGYLFLISRAEWSAMHRYNRAIGDVSLILVAAAMVIGPLTRLIRKKWLRALLPYRRELGIWAVVAASIHLLIILIGWVELDLWRLFGFEFHPGLQRYVMILHGFALANAVGIIALLYGLALALTSNDFSQRRLGPSVWKFVQQGSYILWWLVILHTAYFLYVHFLDFHRETPEPNWAQWPFAGLVMAVMLVQMAATIKTWRQKQTRERTPTHGIRNTN